MLILTRKVGEILKIGDDVEITALGMKGGRIRLGIRAPRRVPVHRMEVYEKINRLEPAITLTPSATLLLMNAASDSSASSKLMQAIDADPLNGQKATHPSG